MAGVPYAANVVGVLVLFGTLLGQLFGAWAWLRDRIAARSEPREKPGGVLFIPNAPQEDATPPAESASKADVRIDDIVATGGTEGRIDFRLELANYGSRRCRATVSAHVDEREVEVHPSTVELLVNVPRTELRVLVPRPEIGDLVPALNNETTLYGKTLRVDVDCDGRTTSRDWREHIYDEATESQRHAIQQRAWRLGRGQETPEDRRAEHLSDRELRAAERHSDWEP